MNEKKARELTDSIFSKSNDQERVYLAWIHNRKNKEIERLNNIINELEKYVIDREERSWDDNGAYDDVLDKLQELKRK